MLKHWKPIVLVILSFFLFQNVQGQVLWNKLYTDNAPVNAKGDYSSHTTGFIATGHNLTTSGNNLAYLLETNMNGNITWQTYIGDSVFNFYGLSVKETSNGSYVVVGKTDKNQSYAGAYTDSCTLNPYYNAFIAFVDPDSSAANWFHVFGDSLLHDEAVEVIEDQFGDFVVVGQANARLSADTCYLNDSTYTAPSGNDVSSILLSKFNAQGAMMFNRTLDFERYDSGVSLINDTVFNTYVLLANRRDTNQATFVRPLLIQTNILGIPFNQMEYDPGTQLDKPGYELLKVVDDYFVVGQEFNNNRVGYTSYFLLADLALMNPTYTVLTHRFTDLLLRDVEEDNDTLVLSGDSWLYQMGNQQKEQVLMKVVVNASRYPSIVPLFGVLNLSHYRAFGVDRNKNFCIYPYTDTFSNTFNGYHLFGNSSGMIHQVKTDHSTASHCWELDSVGRDTMIIPFVPWHPILDTLDVYDTFGLITPFIAEYAICDTLPEPYRDETLDIVQVEATGLKIYPNPAAHKLHISIDQEENRNVLVSIADIRGVVLYQKSWNKKEGTVNVHNFPPGPYIVSVVGSHFQQQVRFVKIH